MKKQWLTTKEVAKLTGKSYFTILDWMNAGVLPFKKFGPGKPNDQRFVNINDVPAFLRKV